jgi:copper(I)-binding protein
MSLKLLIAAASLVVAVSSGALAQGVEVKDAWARATPAGAQTAAAYVTIVSPTADRLTGVATPEAQKAELHSMTMEGGVMKMRPIDGLDLPAGTLVTLKPGGYHIMLTGLAKPLREGDTFPLTLSFANAGTQQVTVTVGKVGAMGPPGQTGQAAPHGGMDMPMHH